MKQEELEALKGSVWDIARQLDEVIDQLMEVDVIGVEKQKKPSPSAARRTAIKLKHMGSATIERFALLLDIREALAEKQLDAAVEKGYVTVKGDWYVYVKGSLDE